MFYLFSRFALPLFLVQKLLYIQNAASWLLLGDSHQHLFQDLNLLLEFLPYYHLASTTGTLFRFLLKILKTFHYLKAFLLTQGFSDV